MQRTVTVEVPNALLFVMDKSIGEIPSSMNSALVSSTNTCIAVGTRTGIDGATFIVLTDEHLDSTKFGTKVADQSLETPSRILTVCDVYDVSLLEIGVPLASTRVRIGVDDPREPSLVTIQVSE